MSELLAGIRVVESAMLFNGDTPLRGVDTGDWVALAGLGYGEHDAQALVASGAAIAATDAQ